MDLVQCRFDRLHHGAGHRFAVLFFDLAASKSTTTVCRTAWATSG
jgi:hypothetical protein